MSKKFVIVLVAALVILAGLVWLARPMWYFYGGTTVYVRDVDTSQPIAQATVSADFQAESPLGLIIPFLPPGAIEEGDAQVSDNQGKAFISLHNAPNNSNYQIGLINHISVSKEGYHSQFLGEQGWADPYSATIALSQDRNPQNLLMEKLGLSSDESVDFLSPLLGDYSKKIVSTSTDIQNIDFDIFNAQSSTGEFIMRFYGNGGVQQIADATSTANEPYVLENLLTTPENGYVSQLALQSGGEYVARLRDGKHYMKFYVLGFGGESGTPKENIFFYIQQNETNNLETAADLISDNASSLELGSFGDWDIITGALSATNPKSAQLIQGAQGVEVLAFDLANRSLENITIKNLELICTGRCGSNLGDSYFTNLHLYDQDGIIGSYSPFGQTLNIYPQNGIVLAPNTKKTFFVKVDIGNNLGPDVTTGSFYWYLGIIAASDVNGTVVVDSLTTFNGNTFVIQ